ncbi:hypothetical protein Kpol_1042p3 [Vanderwaltozyma polyspora DSM 70294]|uniref:Uncharacterized protein n=1 Tax=Vanderwaltozyma polyspora (strain ATCC 22028 / DSM 70294 / BCRC 21397 / CBS 2163 / NBRC 10782 / NRRL Y-8283 / UCD 57-17) TaxID=436907 RepID=A7TQ92_VANPO|nr:uncharacterized protein Kpol_1042p3 [Vanderwaltozyma polyspora DSM 70294]EDO15546.1 hypothetical protein Kpol_1042p3 [Vanderwaltozyma polyspora DSM 70294]
MVEVLNNCPEPVKNDSSTLKENSSRNNETFSKLKTKILKETNETLEILQESFGLGSTEFSQMSSSQKLLKPLSLSNSLNVKEPVNCAVGKKRTIKKKIKKPQSRNIVVSTIFGKKELIKRNESKSVTLNEYKFTSINYNAKLRKQVSPDSNRHDTTLAGDTVESPNRIAITHSIPIQAPIQTSMSALAPDIELDTNVHLKYSELIENFSMKVISLLNNEIDSK